MSPRAITVLPPPLDEDLELIEIPAFRPDLFSEDDRPTTWRPPARHQGAAE